MVAIAKLLIGGRVSHCELGQLFWIDTDRILATVGQLQVDMHR